MQQHKRDIVDTAECSWVDAYRRLTEVVIPRPIALVGTVDREGAANLAPFSFFTVVSSTPPFVAFSPHRLGRTGGKKDTLRNIETTNEFTISVVTEAIAEKVNSCAAPLPYGDSEFEHSGLTQMAARKVNALAESSVAMIGRLRRALLAHDGLRAALASGPRLWDLATGSATSLFTVDLDLLDEQQRSHLCTLARPDGDGCASRRGFACSPRARATRTRRDRGGRQMSDRIDSSRRLARGFHSLLSVRRDSEL